VTAALRSPEHDPMLRARTFALLDEESPRVSPVNLEVLERLLPST